MSGRPLVWVDSISRLTVSVLRVPSSTLMPAPGKPHLQYYNTPDLAARSYVTSCRKVEMFFRTFGDLTISKWSTPSINSTVDPGQLECMSLAFPAGT